MPKGVGVCSETVFADHDNPVACMHSLWLELHVQDLHRIKLARISAWSLPVSSISSLAVLLSSAFLALCLSAALDSGVARSRF